LWNSRVIIAVIYGLLCHGLFAFGIGTMVVMMYFGMSRSLGTAPSPWGWWLNGALLGQFVLGHSFLLSVRGQKLLKRLAPESLGSDLSTTTYALVASIQVGLLFAFWTPSGVVLWKATGWAQGLLTILYLSSWLLLFKAMRDAGFALQTGYLGWSAVVHNQRPVHPKILDRGLFQYCRQPIYVGFSLTTWTVPTWTPDQVFIASMLTLYCLVGPRFKEKRYQAFHGDKYTTYASHVPYWLPRLPQLRKKQVVEEE